MAQTIFPGTIYHHGPFILSEEDFDNLDSRLDHIWEELIQDRELSIRTLVSNTPELKEKDPEKAYKECILLYPYSKEKKSVILSLDSGKKIKGQSFSDIKKDLGLTKDLPIGFEIDFSCGKGNFSLNINSGFNTYGDKLKYSLECEGEKYYKDIVFTADSWVESIKPKEEVKLWKKSNGWAGGILIGVIIVIFTVAIASANNERDYYREELKSLINENLKIGVNDTTIYSSIELLLKLNSGYMPEDYAVEVERINSDYLKKNKFLLIAAFVLLIPFSLSPRTVIGLGGMKRKYRFWKFWIRLWTYSIPVLIVIPIVLHFVLR